MAACESLCTEFGTTGAAALGESRVSSVALHATTPHCVFSIYSVQLQARVLLLGPYSLLYIGRLCRPYSLLYTRRLYRRVVSDGYAYTDTNCEALLSTVHCTVSLPKTERCGLISLITHA